MTNPKPISLTQVDAGDYDSPFAPEPMVVVGDMPGGGGAGGPAAWSDITGKPAVIAAGADAEAARVAIGIDHDWVDDIRAPLESNVQSINDILQGISEGMGPTLQDLTARIEALENAAE